MSSNKQVLKARALRYLLILFLYTAVSSWCLSSFMREWSLLEGSQRASLEAMTEGTAHRPFAYRALIPFVVNQVAKWMPDGLRESLAQSTTIYAFWKIEPRPSADLTVKYHITLLLMFLSLFLMMFMVRLTTKVQWPKQELLCDVSPLLMVILLPMTFVQGGYFYDFPELLGVFTAFFLCITQRFAWLLALLPLMILNKESNLVVPALLAPIFYHHLGFKKTIYWTAGLTLLGLPPFLSLRHLYQDNPGSQIEFHLYRNIEYYCKLECWLSFFDIYVPMVRFPKGFNIASILLVGGMALFQWRKKPPVLKQLLIVAAVINLPLLLFFCYKDELRNLSLLFPALYLVSVDTMARLYPNRA